MIKRIFITALGTLVSSSFLAQNIEDAMKFNASGIMVYRTKMALSAENVANGLTLYDEETGLPYQKKYAVLTTGKMGVKIQGIERSTEPFGRYFDSTVPQSDENGFFYHPNVNLPNEMMNVKYAETLFEANVNAYKISKSMYMNTLEILK